MQVSTTVTNQTGTVTYADEVNNWAATTEYNFPDGSTALSDAPKYTKRTDDWRGRTSASAAETLYNAPEPAYGATTRTSNITVLNGDHYVDYETVSHNTGDWMNGLVKETAIYKVTVDQFQQRQRVATMSKTVYHWKEDQNSSGRKNPRLEKIEVTNDAGQTKTTEYVYDQYNNQKEIKEYNYNQPTVLLRTTKIDYVTDSNWINANLLGLVKSVENVVGGVTVSKTLYEYDHNGNDTNIVGRSDIANTGTHDTYYNRGYPSRTETFCPNGTDGSGDSEENGCVTIYHPGYNAASAYRGNVTKVGRMIDLAATSITATNSDKSDYNYDIAGNLVSATLSCCQLKTFDYGQNFDETGYAYPVKENKGDPALLTTEATYNRNTGLVTFTTDKNGETTEYQYETDTLRPKKTIYPNGGYTETEYSDKLGTDPIGYIRTKTTLEANKIVQSYSYFNGRGDQIRSAAQTPDGWSVSAVEYDSIGRVRKNYNPFYSSAANGAIPAGTKYTEVTAIDALGRTTNVKLQDDTTVSTVFSTLAATPTGFNKTFITVTDQAGKQRRQVMDALGRVVRVDEPDLNGSLGTVSAPAQPTGYEYDGNDNLIKVVQSMIDQNGQTITQERKFKYDPLSRLTHERQVEASATLDDSGIHGAPASTKWTKYLKYKPDGLLDYGIDARGVKTTFGYDGLNRIQTITYSYGTPNVIYTYDQVRYGANGVAYSNSGALTRVETVQNPTNPIPDTPTTATEFDYDKMGRVVAHRQIIGGQTYSLDYGYNLAGQLTSQKYPSGKIVSFGYDTGGRLSSIADQSRTFLSGLQYLGKGNSVNQMTLGNGTTQSFTLNDRLQMINQELKRGAEVLQKYDYGYGQIDVNGNLDVMKNNGKLARIESYIGMSKQWTKKFIYDAVGRLNKEEENRGDNSALVYRNQYDYDRFGNLFREQASNASSLTINWIERTDISKTTNRFTTNTLYDDAGNVITDTKFRNQNYWYDANGRMYKTASTNSPNQSNAVFDAAGQRVATQFDGVWTFFIYDAFGKMVAEYGGFQAMDEGGVKYLLQDWQGSSRAVVSQGGYVQARMDYTAFGEQIYANVGQRTTQQGFSANSNVSQKYALTERDKATGLDHTWFRKLENRAGRWTSPDPYNGSINLGNPQSFNRYSYVVNNPIGFIDPTGLQQARPGDACSYSGRKDGDGNPLYDGTIDKNGICQSHAGSPVTVYWFPTWMLHGNTTPISPREIRDITLNGGGGGNERGSTLQTVGFANNYCGAVAGVFEYKPVYWRGPDGRFIKPPVNISNVARGVSQGTFVVGTGITVAQMTTGEVSPIKGGVDIIMGYAGAFGGPKGMVAAGGYFLYQSVPPPTFPQNGARVVNTNTCHGGSSTFNPR